jgi:uncharacterized protein (TIGR03435 family)
MKDMRPTIFLFLAASAFAQNPPDPAFDVASVRINQQYQVDNVQTWSAKTDVKPGSLTMTNVSLVSLIKWAYHIQRYQIVQPDGLEFRRPGGNYVDTARYDLLAKCDKPVTDEEMRPMLQTLLAERFHLQFHRETRTLSVYAMVEAKGGHKMRPSQLTKAEDGKQDPQGGNLARGVSMEEVASELADSRDFNVALIDATGLKGRFDFEINIRKYIPQMKPGDPPPEILTIVQDALLHEIGLKLESRKVPIEMLVIDHLEKTPAEN